MTRLFNLDFQLLHDVVLMAIAVFFLFMMMSKLLFNPVRKMLADRREKIAGELSDAANDKKDAAALKADYEARLKNIDKEAEQILSEARQKAQKNAARIESEAKEEAARIIQRANEEAELSKKRAMDDVKQEMITVASMMAAKVVAANIDASVQDALVEETLKEMGDSTWQSIVSKVYGDALFEVAVESGRLDEIWEQTRAMQTALEENPELFALMRHPKIVKEEKVKIIESIFTGEVCAELVGLLRMIVEKDHFAQIGKVLAYFDDQVKEYKSIGTAYVTTAMELSDAQKAAVVKRLLETTKYVTFEMHYEVDSAIIGGMMIRIGDRVVDSTVRTKLYDLTRELSKIQLKAGECAP